MTVCRNILLCVCVLTLRSETKTKGLAVSDEVRCARSGYMIPILATDNKLRKKEWAIEFEGSASFFACRHYTHTLAHLYC